MKKEWGWHCFQLLGRQQWQVYHFCSFGVSGPRKSDSFVTKHFFWLGECFRMSKIRFIDFFWNYFRGSNGSQLEVSGLSSQVSGVRSQKLMLSLTRFARFETDASANQICPFFDWCYRFPDFHFLTDAIAYQICPFYNDAIANQICPFYNWCYR